jgi:hypothetical protein
MQQTSLPFHTTLMLSKINFKNNVKSSESVFWTVTWKSLAVIVLNTQQKKISFSYLNAIILFNPDVWGNIWHAIVAYRLPVISIIMTYATTSLNKIFNSYFSVCIQNAIRVASQASDWSIALWEVWYNNARGIHMQRKKCQGGLSCSACRQWCIARSTWIP